MNNSMSTWVELKKMNPTFQQILKMKSKARKASTMDSLNEFCREADKHLK